MRHVSQKRTLHASLPSEDLARFMRFAAEELATAVVEPLGPVVWPPEVPFLPLQIFIWFSGIVTLHLWQVALDIVILSPSVE